MKESSISRRDFLVGAATTTLGIAATGLLSGCLTTGGASAAGIYKPGIYSATAHGIGTVTATVAFDSNRIIDVKLDLVGESEGVGQKAKDRLIQNILASQSGEVDAVSGATMTSSAVKEAVESCIGQAKGLIPIPIPSPSTASSSASGAQSWLGEAPKISDSAIVENWKMDLLIVGAGNGGLVAAAKAADLGLKFRIIESMSVVADTRSHVGAINSKYTYASGTEVDIGLYLSEFSRYTSGKCNQRVVKKFIAESGEMIEYVGKIVDQYGFNVVTNFDEWPAMEHETPYYAPPQEHMFVPRKDSKYASWSRNQILADYIAHKGSPVDFSTELVELLKAKDAVVGAIAKTSKGYVRIDAKNVILACGGYEGDDEMMIALQPLAAQVLVGHLNYPPDKGQGVKAALWAGADRDVEPAPMIFDRGIVKPGVDGGYQRQADGSYLLPGGYFQTSTEYNPGTQPFLKVNRRGERFANESSPYNDIVYAASHQPGHVYCQVYDADYKKYWEQFHTVGCSALPRLRPEVMSKLLEDYAAAGIIQKALTLEELADKLGFVGTEKATFLATCQRQNENFANGKDPDFYKPARRLSAIRSAPFYGVWMGGNILCTGDGIKINESMQALNKLEEVVPGLYCAGNTSGSFFAGNYPTMYAGTCVGRAMTESLVAVKVIAGID